MKNRRRRWGLKSWIRLFLLDAGILVDAPPLKSEPLKL